MLTLALDSTTPGGSLALRRDGRLLAERVGDASRPYAERLPQDVISLVDDHQCRIADIDLYGVAAGPGSFTGLRIGIAAIQGLALVHGRPVAAVSALDALAEAGSQHMPWTVDPAHGQDQSRAVIAVWMDGRRGQVFAALYACESQGAVTALDAPRAEAPAETMARWSTRWAASRPWIFVGDGCRLHRHVIEAARRDAVIVDPTPPLAAQIAAIAERMAASGQAGPPGAIRPLYVRPSDAELARDRRDGDADRAR